MRSLTLKNTSSILIFLLVAGCGSKVPFTRGAPAQGDQTKLSGATALPDLADFDRFVLPVLEQNCASCHENPAPNYATALTLVKAGRPAESDLYLKATGQKSHKMILKIESQQARNIEDWINSATPSEKPVPGTPQDVTPSPAAPQSPVTPAPSVPQSPVSPPPVAGSSCVVVANTGKKICEDLFVAKVLPALVKSCDRCHDNPAADYATAVTIIKPGLPLESDLYLKGTGSSHKKVWAVDSEEAKNLEAWITGI